MEYLHLIRTGLPKVGPVGQSWSATRYDLVHQRIIIPDCQGSLVILARRVKVHQLRELGMLITFSILKEQYNSMF